MRKARRVLQQCRSPGDIGSPSLDGVRMNQSKDGVSEKGGTNYSRRQTKQKSGVITLVGGGRRLVLLGLERLDAIVQRRDNLSLRDAEARARRNVAHAALANGRVLAANAAHAQAQRLAHLLGLGVRAVGGEVG